MSLDVLKAAQDLAEGRTDPEVWIAWWTSNEGELEKVLGRYWYLKLKPRGSDQGVEQALTVSHSAACEFLTKKNISFESSDRYQSAWKIAFARFCQEREAETERKAKSFQPVLSALTALFPKFARLLSRRATSIDRLEGPATEEEIAVLEKNVSAALPASYKQFLRCTKAIQMDGFSLGLDVAFVVKGSESTKSPADGLLCVGDFWLEADGDQIMFDLSLNVEEPPVLYYAHAVPELRRVAPTFATWIESLSRSPVFREN